MPREREHASKRIKTVDYDIEGNLIRAWYDGAGELIFVLDETINRDKPNVLLVLDSFDDRKWDDILSNDYGIDLETVRPKKDNKYQKLDIEYGGLDVYSDLIDAYESDGDLDESLEKLKRFQIMSVRRAAKERLTASEEIIRKTQETIERTNDTISELRARLKELRAKLAEQKRAIGREPTKTSASKILKTESQIDATNEKLARAKKRLANAQRRLVVAEDDADVARAILARRVDVKPAHKPTTRPVRAARTRPVRVAAEEAEEVADEDESFDEEDNYDEDLSESEPYDAVPENEDDNDVKPLFDRDPNVLDDSIAFKPIDFDSGASTATTPSNTEDVEPIIAPAPLSFTPPPADSDVFDSDDNDTATDTPMLDSLTTVVEPEPTTADVETTTEPVPLNTNESEITVTEEKPIEEIQPMPVAEIESVMPVEPITPSRPVSPISGNVIVQSDEQRAKKPTLIYYLMLILLIGLSIFTLWLYQQKNGAVVPDLAITTNSVQKTSTDAVVTNDVNEEPDVKVEIEKQEVVSEPTVPVVSETTAPEPAAPVIEPEPVSVTVSKPEVVQEQTVVNVVAEEEPQPQNISVESPFVDLRTVATYEPEKKPIPTEEEILARKPGYNVSQNDKMFVASPEYDTETVADVAVVPDDDVAYSMDTDVQPVMVPEIVASETVATVNSDSEPATCVDGLPADENGCCPGEEYLNTADGYMCCVEDDCFPPLN